MTQATLIKTGLADSAKSESKKYGTLSSSCVHHWIIEPPDKPLSKGWCKKCGAEKEFANDIFPEDTAKEDEE